MLLPRLREEVLEANLELVRRGLVLYTFGNASGISREQNLVVIKPSGVPYETMKPEHLIVTDLDGKIVEGSLRPSSDLPTHLVLYRAFPGLAGLPTLIPSTPPPGPRRASRFRASAPPMPTTSTRRFPSRRDGRRRDCIGV